MKYTKIKANLQNISIGTYPVYSDKIYNGKEPMKVVGIRQSEIELEGDYSGGIHNVVQKGWEQMNDCFLIQGVCEEQLKPNGCQIHNVNCCGGGKIQTSHINKYWDNLL